MYNNKNVEQCLLKLMNGANHLYKQTVRIDVNMTFVMQCLSLSVIQTVCIKNTVVRIKYTYVYLYKIKLDNYLKLYTMGIWI